MAAVRVVELLLEGFGIGEVAVVHKHDAVRGVDIKRLAFFIAVSITLCGIANLTQAAIA